MIIKLRDYERIFQIVSAIIDAEGEDVAHSCVYYSVLSSSILEDHFRKRATVRCGLAIYHVGGEGELLCFGEKMSEGITATENNFHSWVEVDEWIIDFMAPNFGFIHNTEFTKRRKMFQKRKSQMTMDPREFKEAGQFLLRSNPELERIIIEPTLGHPGVQDLRAICSQWFKKTPQKIMDRISITDQAGDIKNIDIGFTKIESNW